MRNSVILGLSIGTKKMGTAVLDGQVLIDYQTKSFRGAWSPVKLRAIRTTVETLVQEHAVTRISAKMPPVHLCSPAIQQIVNTVKRLAKKYCIPFEGHTLSSLKEGLSPTDRINKQQLVQLVLGEYPVLLGRYKKEKKSKRRYYSQLFEAVQAAHHALARDGG